MDKSVGIVTYFPNNNYGCLMQAFSLQTKVYILGYRSQIIALEPSYKYFTNMNGRYKFLRFILGWYRFLKRHLALRQFKNFNFCQTTKLFYDIEKSNDLSFDVLIAGSDQIWHPNGFIQNMGGANFYFLNFGRSILKRIAYAPSLSVKQWPKEFEQKVLPMLQRFDAISVREESSVPYLNSLGLKNVVCVCDPTILHKGDFYREHFQGAIVDSKRYAFIYKIRELIPDSVSEILPNEIHTVDLQKRKTMVSVTQWLANIDHAEFVVTDSFHCAVFCLLFHKPFLVIPNRSHGKGMNERFATLLGKTNLEYRVLSCEESKEQVLNILNRPIDWDYVDAILEEWRTYSGNWLKQALEK